MVVFRTTANMILKQVFLNHRLIPLLSVQQLLREAEERASAVGNEPTPKITRGHVTVSFARSGGPGGQNVNKVNTKVDMRFNVKNAYWLSDRIRERIMQMMWEDLKLDKSILLETQPCRLLYQQEEGL
ncbi:hypothetical protein OIU77_023121 [Salix suchowensis]|uniref:Prokaryotic-type class I peptide chain release factors domain-containing protein n=1 Tax=Salix suchowensis TaxID=1278906 RepID=A0ABQ9C5T5_9ROSI|nr:hypothetical protein OIU77_023121 [Salix suchowensis]